MTGGDFFRWRFFAKQFIHFVLAYQNSHCNHTDDRQAT